MGRKDENKQIICYWDTEGILEMNYFNFLFSYLSLIALMLNIITNPFPYSTTAHDLYINHLVLVGWIVIVNTLRAYNHK